MVRYRTFQLRSPAVLEQIQELVESTFNSASTSDRRDGPMPEFLEVISARKVLNGANWEDYIEARESAKANRDKHGPADVVPRAVLMTQRLVGWIYQQTLDGSFSAVSKPKFASK